MSKEVYLTKEKLEQIQKELKELLEVKRPEVIGRIKDARALGDLSENAEYHSAREEQGFIEGRIEELEYMVKNASIISDDGKKKDRVGLGATVVTSSEGEKVTFKIVGSAEVDVANGRISNESPIGKAMMNKKEGETVEVETPGGKMKYKILKIT
ncbi:MAG TPA: transcription elongation factor GreA [Patescibacteria group bacterium]|nr:transcription elongation factor GreA [Patescibacteria group bacterium]